MFRRGIEILILLLFVFSTFSDSGLGVLWPSFVKENHALKVVWAEKFTQPGKGGQAASHHLLYLKMVYCNLTRFTAASLRFTAPKMRGTEISVITD